MKFILRILTKGIIILIIYKILNHYHIHCLKNYNDTHIFKVQLKALLRINRKRTRFR